jgi:hypothetical protein
LAFLEAESRDLRRVILDFSLEALVLKSSLAS